MHILISKKVSICLQTGTFIYKLHKYHYCVHYLDVLFLYYELIYYKTYTKKDILKDTF